MFAGLLVASLLGTAACAGTHFDGTTLEKKHVAYRVGRLDPSFSRVQVEGNDLSFHHDGAGTVSVQATCGDYEDVPASALVNHLLFGTTQRAYVLEEEVTIDGRGTAHTIVDCELDGVPVRIEVYLHLRNGCAFDLSYVSARAAPAHAAFTRFVQGFHVERAGHD